MTWRCWFDVMNDRPRLVACAVGAGVAVAALIVRWRNQNPRLVYGDDEPVVMMDSEHGMAVRMVHGVPYVGFITEACVDALRAGFAPRSGDVIIATSPKCGTTWMQQIGARAPKQHLARRAKRTLASSPLLNDSHRVRLTGRPASSPPPHRPSRTMRRRREND